MKAIVELVDYYGWRSVIAIFIDDDYGMNAMLALEDVLLEKWLKISHNGLACL